MTKRTLQPARTLTRPSCPHCGSRNVLARVKGFFCRRCGREWEKGREAAAESQTAPQEREGGHE